MKDEALHFDPLPLRDMPVDAIFLRLRFHPHLTMLKDRDREETERVIGEAKSLLSMKGAVRRLEIKISASEGIILETGDLLSSAKLTSFLQGVREVLLMAATAGSGITDRISELIEKGELARASILDAVASETTDAALDWISRYVRQIVRREGKTVGGSRFSPGYGDFGLENQLIFHRLLDLGKIGISVSPSFMLIPEKSVTAITGLSARL
ncbi:MAG: hypothetical protein N2572_09885 [Syntrophales bacterium]|nr:hypothetical protein [Syntrophales bacterium]